MDSERCFFMLCIWQTEQVCIDRNLFGDKARIHRKWEPRVWQTKT